MQRATWLILLIIVLIAIGSWLWWRGGGLLKPLSAPSTPIIQGPSGPPSVVGPSAPPPSQTLPTRAITIQGDEFRFEPKEIHVRPGERIALTFRNKGRASHTFTIPELEIDTGVVPVGDEFKLTFTAPDTNLTYQSICTVPGHKEAGMVGRLIVE